MSDTPQPAAKAPQAAPARGGKLALLALTLSVAVAAGGYYWTRFVAEPGANAARARLDDASAERDTLTKRVTDGAERLARFESVQGEMLASIESLRTANTGLSAALKELARRRRRRSSRWTGCWPNVNT